MPCESKAALRRVLLARRSARSAAALAHISHAIAERIKQESCVNTCKVIFLYCSKKDEISTQEILEYALSCRKIVCTPRCTAEGEMIACRIRSRADLVPGRFGILEPAAQCEEIPPQHIEVVIAPCLGADGAGYRLGYGGGYYDRFLRHTQGAAVFALCAEDCVVPTVYPEKHDVRCTKIITEREVPL